MEVVLGGTCFAEAWAAWTALEEWGAFGPFAALGGADFCWEGCEGRGDAVLEADGIDKEPFWRGLEMWALASEPVFEGAEIRVCLGAVCGFLEGIP
jgi:hypothetical protein